MSYALSTLWHERQRYLPAVLAVAFSALLIALQFGLLFGLFAVTSLPVDNAGADIWVTGPGVLSIDQGAPIPESYLSRVASQPEVERCEIYLKGLASWLKPADRGHELCMIIGSRLQEDALGALRQLTPQHRDLLTEPGAVIVDRAELGRLGVGGVGDVAEINGHRVRIVGLLEGLRSIAAPYVFCSIETARMMLGLAPGQTTYVLASYRDPADAAVVVERLRADPNVSAFTRAEFSRSTRWHWMVKTKAGIALGCAALLGLIVGAAVTVQTLYAATAASRREYAVLEALGIETWRMCALVMTQSFWVGLLGIGLAVPAIVVSGQAVEALGGRIILPSWLLGSATALTMVMALLSGLVSLRSLGLARPDVLLR